MGPRIHMYPARTYTYIRAHPAGPRTCARVDERRIFFFAKVTFRRIVNRVPRERRLKDTEKADAVRILRLFARAVV